MAVVAGVEIREVMEVEPGVEMVVMEGVKEALTTVATGVETREGMVDKWAEALVGVRVDLGEIMAILGVEWEAKVVDGAIASLDPSKTFIQVSWIRFSVVQG